MDIKTALLDLISGDNIRRSYMAVENLVQVMLTDYISKQGKKLIPDSRVDRYIFDWYAPDGFDNFAGRTAIELKVFRMGHFSYSIIYDIIGRISMHDSEIDNLVLIILSEIPPCFVDRVNKDKVNLKVNLSLWDIDMLVTIFSENRELFEETYQHLNEVLLKNAVLKSIAQNRLEYAKQQQKQHLYKLNHAYHNDDIVLFLGAGVSKEAQIATWDTLISNLFVELIDKQLTANGITIDDATKKEISKEVILQNGKSSLLQTRFLRSGFKKDFEEIISKVLYKDAVETSGLLDEIAQLCIPNRGKIGIQAIINYNFDDLIEKNLSRRRVRYHSIYGEGMMPNNAELGIFHVHGFLPEKKDSYEDLSKSLLVFSEEGYHKLLLEPYNWANITQLNFLINNTCLFIGLSMTDPNLRRLLEIAAQKNSGGDNTCKHYAIMKRFLFSQHSNSETVQKFEAVNQSLQESLFEELGINIVWISDYGEIPRLIKQIRDFS